MIKDTHKEILANKIIENLKKRDMQGFYVKNKEEAKKKALELIENGSEIAFGGSQTLVEIGLIEALHNGDYKVYDRAKAKNQEEIDAIYRQAFSCDYYLASSNAITLDGLLVNIDGSGNRVAAMTFGPKNVILVIGMNKVAQDEKSAIDRIKTYASPMNTIRLEKNTPCKIKGTCYNCLCDDTICCVTSIIRKSRIKDRIKVILVGEDLGY